MNSKTTLSSCSVRRTAILLAAMMVLTCAAYAAFQPQIISWFSNHYGQRWGMWMEEGSAAQVGSSVEVNGAVFTIDEVLVRGRGLYILGNIKAKPGHMLVEQDGSIHDPFGYNIHYGETAPEGTPTIAQKAAEQDANVHYVSCYLEGVGVNGGTVLQPDCWGYSAEIQKDGSIVFSMETEDGMVVEAGKEYTLVLRARTYGTLEDGSIDYDDRTDQVWNVTVIPELLQQSQSEETANTEENTAVSFPAAAAGSEMMIKAPEEYLRTGTLPVYHAEERDFTSVVEPEWFNLSGIAERTEGKNHYVCVKFQDEGQLEWDQNSVWYATYHGTVEIPAEYENGETVMETHPRPSMANAAATLAGWMLYGWPETEEVYALDQTQLSGISYEEAQKKAEELFERLGMNGYVCEKAIDMSLARIREKGAQWNALIESGRMLNNPVLDYSQATAADEGYLLLYYRYGNESDIGGMFHASVYVTAGGIEYVNIGDRYDVGNVYSTPDTLVEWTAAAERLPAELSAARWPMTLDEIIDVRLTWCPVRIDQEKDGMVLTPVWMIRFNAHDDEQNYDGMHAIYDAVDGHLIDGNWV